MILRRVALHLRRQDWIAVSIELVVVVLGVFIGLQAANWNEERLSAKRGAVYAEQLKAELRFEHEYANALIAYNQSTLQAGQMAYQGLTGKTGLNDEAILIHAFRATQYNWYERRRATFDEVVASGSLSLIADQDLLATAVGFYNSPLFDLMIEEGQDAKYRTLFRMTIEPDVQDALARACGDKEYAIGGVAAGLLTLDYACGLDISDSDIAQAVLALKTDPEIIRALRLRNAETVGRIGDIELTLRSLGMAALFPELNSR